MILFTADDKPIRTDLIHSMVLRSDLSPMPVTLEAEIRVDFEAAKLFAVDKIIKSIQGDKLRIVKSVVAVSKAVQGSTTMDTVKITAILDVCHTVANTLGAGCAIIKENTDLSAIYKAAKATIDVKKSESFKVDRFYCLTGETPSFHIARILQESGGVIRWQAKNGLQFYTLDDLFKQKAKVTLPNDEAEDVASDFIERHEIPRFFSLSKADGKFLLSAQNGIRSVRYSPFKTAKALRDMSRCLVLKKITRIMHAPQIEAGDLIEFIGGKPLCVITAAHVYESGANGADCDQYTRLWLGAIGGQ